MNFLIVLSQFHYPKQNKFPSLSLSQSSLSILSKSNWLIKKEVIFLRRWRKWRTWLMRRVNRSRHRRF
ncbi:hypothetical protein GQ457_16G030440 [Hibiscus cannabinus]